MKGKRSKYFRKNNWRESKINEIINEDQIELDMFKVSYYFLAIKTKLNKNNFNLLELFEDLIRDIHSDKLTMSYVLYLISFSFSFEQLYESIHILEKSTLLKSKFIMKDAKTIFNELAIEEKRFDAERIMNEKEQMRRFQNNQEYNELEKKKKIVGEEKELHFEQINPEINSCEYDNINPLSESFTPEKNKENIEIGKTFELSLFENQDLVVDENDKKSDFKKENVEIIKLEKNKEKNNKEIKSKTKK
jgi:hypothetical protein